MKGSLVAVLAVAIGCAGREPPPTGQAPTQAPSAPPRRASTPLAWLGAPCPDEGCPQGLACVRYCGVAGCRSGVFFQTCEIPCKTSAQCPEGLGCGTVADGPGRVCRGGRAPQPGGRGEPR